MLKFKLQMIKAGSRMFAVHSPCGHTVKPVQCYQAYLEPGLHQSKPRKKVIDKFDSRILLWCLARSLTQSQAKFQMFGNQTKGKTSFSVQCWEAVLQPDTVYYLS